MQRRENGWYPTLVATGAPPLRVDELLASVRELQDLRGAPLRREGWIRRDYGLRIDRGRDGLPIHFTILAYTVDAAAVPFVPNVSSADGVLFLRSGAPHIDDATEQGLQQALRKRPGEAPIIIEVVPADAADDAGIKAPLRSLVRRVVEALRESALPDFWALVAEDAAARAHDEHFGGLVADRIRQQPAGGLVRHLLGVTYHRACRAVSEGRVASHSEYQHRLGRAWRELFALNAVEVYVRDSGVSPLFGAPGDRHVSPEELSLAIGGYERLGAAKKAEILATAVDLAEKNGLSNGFPDGWHGSPAREAFEALGRRFDAAEDEDIHRSLEDEIRRDPTPFELPPFEAEW